METPSSIRRVTRSQTLAAANSVNDRTVEDYDSNGLSKSRERSRNLQDLAGAKGQDRSALIDITNDSPIVSLAAGNLTTPISSATKQRSFRPKMMTPGSGEALLRGQVKTLLQKVEEEAEISKLSLDSWPAGLLDPIPANMLQILDTSRDGNLFDITNDDPVDVDLFKAKKQEENQITRSLLLDFAEKSEIIDEDTSSDCSSVLARQEKLSSLSPSLSQDDDVSSLWSIQANASSHGKDVDEEELIEHEDEDEEEEEEVDKLKWGLRKISVNEKGKAENFVGKHVRFVYDSEEELIEDEEEEEDNEDGLVDELCWGLSKISVNEKGKAKNFTGKHTRFVYDSEDELIEEVSDESHDEVSPSVLHLKGVPTPKGKHLRFQSESE
ncbi:uncharacterized protein LOC111809658 [Cucurbita pepo subsp. pepo]|uniref:uncharacterized protein LOC111809658 n=1 Tax=Cucurbita pepo subsp. pepo TaxID=3664 RepID=UPI000C9D638E|nr:uncharacterized protein LOC111809658 [Cucurbita pepo subsp. pepo]